jgi:hypothetical protein
VLYNSETAHAASEINRPPGVARSLQCQLLETGVCTM